eukprot:Nk52_evm8s1869 gene=Nk52_evmTU8s1869
MELFIFVKTVRGLEQFCAEEVAERFPKAVTVPLLEFIAYIGKGVATVGKCVHDERSTDNLSCDCYRQEYISCGSGVVFLYTCAPTNEVIEEVRMLQGALKVGCLLDVVLDLKHEPLDECFKRLQGLPLLPRVEGNWDNALRVWRYIHRNISLDEPLEGFEVTFKGVVERNRWFQRESLKSIEVAANLGAAVVEKFGWKVDCTNYELELFGSVSEAELAYGVTLFNDLHKRNRRDSCEWTTMLNPVLSYLLARMCKIKPGQVICDPMCGVGTIPIEAALNYPLASYIGGDIEEGPVRDALSNARLVGLEKKGVAIEFAVWDIEGIPLRKESLDCICSDVPFGVKHSSVKKLWGLYRRLLQFVEMCLKVNGKAVLLTSCKKKMLLALDHSSSLELREEYLCCNGGLRTFVFIIEKTKRAELKPIEEKEPKKKKLTKEENMRFMKKAPCSL